MWQTRKSKAAAAIGGCLRVGKTGRSTSRGEDRWDGVGRGGTARHFPGWHFPGLASVRIRTRRRDCGCRSAERARRSRGGPAGGGGRKVLPARDLRLTLWLGRRLRILPHPDRAPGGIFDSDRAGSRIWRDSAKRTHRPVAVARERITGQACRWNARSLFFSRRTKPGAGRPRREGRRADERPGRLGPDAHRIHHLVELGEWNPNLLTTWVATIATLEKHRTRRGNATGCGVRSTCFPPAGRRIAVIR
jgi:hypothetical protein